MKKSKQKSSDDLDELMSSIDLSEKTELQGVAHEIFTQSPSRSNINPDEKAACFISNIIFPAIGIEDENPVDMFLELSKSQLGWATEKFVQTAAGVQDQRSGGGFFGKFKDAFTPKG